jgi:hypothetical protein
VTGGVSQVAESSTQRNPSSWELPPSSAPAVLERPSPPKEQLYVVKIGLQRPSSTACAMALIHNGYSNPYEPGTKRERAYIASISSIYQDDCIEDAAIVAGNTMKELISEIEVHTQDAEFELDELA